MAAPSYSSADPTTLRPELLEARHRQLVSDLKEIELALYDLGIMYFKLPNDALSELMTVSDVGKCETAFSATTGNPSNIRLLYEARRLRDNARRSLYQSDLATADELLDMAEATIEDLEDDIGGLDNCIFRADRRTESSRFLSRYPYAGLLPTIEQQPDRHQTFRAWLLALPENQKALELGISTEDEIVDEVLQHKEDRWDEPYEAEDLDTPTPSPPPPTPHIMPQTMEAQVNFFDLEMVLTEGAFDLDIELADETLEALEPRHPLALARASREEGQDDDADDMPESAAREPLQGPWSFR